MVDEITTGCLSIFKYFFDTLFQNSNILLRYVFKNTLFLYFIPELYFIYFFLFTVVLFSYFTIIYNVSKDGATRLQAYLANVGKW